MTVAKKKITDYLPEKKKKVSIPARVKEDTVERAQATARKLNVQLCDFIEGAINMACDQAGK